MFPTDLAMECRLSERSRRVRSVSRLILPCRQEIKALSPRGEPLLWARFAGEQAADQKPRVPGSAFTSLPCNTSQLPFPRRSPTPTVPTNTKTELHSSILFHQRLTDHQKKRIGFFHTKVILHCQSDILDSRPFRTKECRILLLFL